MDLAWLISSSSSSSAARPGYGVILGLDEANEPFLLFATGPVAGAAALLSILLPRSAQSEMGIGVLGDQAEAAAAVAA